MIEAIVGRSGSGFWGCGAYRVSGCTILHFCYKKSLIKMRIWPQDLTRFSMLDIVGLYKGFRVSLNPRPGFSE